jgi:hypothetical protein
MRTFSILNADFLHQLPIRREKQLHKLWPVQEMTAL